jgi:hypothetical protein
LWSWGGLIFVLLYIFAHLKKHHKTEVVFDPSDLMIHEAQFEAKDWASSEFGHLDGVEATPAIAQRPRLCD